ncbi:methyltransferase domain-containing protein [Metabacillus sp. GX 13764]|uniref:class I SAM-dependent methyltransferase n=1 Tax=Metabacillus kandeliae TaxID=2900151 RepID=UPI001E41AF68|nr:class I SAM-dependent methyltransferase [Metabacillus kandeliae]MCD7033442.1 methyltransferase domain-containing protein [Metabacillus kandeliae]
MEKEKEWTKLAASLWNERASYWHSSSQNMWEEGSRKKAVAFFEKFVPKQGEVLDIGCGDGYGSWKLYKAGYKVKGIDLSEEMISLAKKHEVPERLTFMEGDMLHLPFEEERAEGIMAINCIEWVPDPLKAVKGMHRVLKKEGYLCAAVLGPSAEPRKASYGRLYHKPAVCNTMMPWEFKQLAEENGFKLKAYEPVYKRGVNSEMADALPEVLRQSLSFLCLFMLQK